MFLYYILIGLILLTGALIFTGNTKSLFMILLWAFAWPIVIAGAIYHFIQFRKARKQ